MQNRDSDELLETFRVEDEEDDPIEVHLVKISVLKCHANVYPWCRKSPKLSKVPQRKA